MVKGVVMQYKRIEGVTERHGYEFVEFKGEKIAFIAQQSLIDVSPIYFPKVRPVSAPKTNVWYIYRLELPKDKTKPLEGGVTVMNHEAIFSREVAVAFAEQAAIKE
jgi:hypothetical protein